jgi:hypothetical protein
MAFLLYHYKKLPGFSFYYILSLSFYFILFYIFAFVDWIYRYDGNRLKRKSLFLSISSCVFVYVFILLNIHMYELNLEKLHSNGDIMCCDRDGKSNKQKTQSKKKQPTKPRTDKKSLRILCEYNDLVGKNTWATQKMRTAKIFQTVSAMEDFFFINLSFFFLSFTSLYVRRCRPISIWCLFLKFKLAFFRSFDSKQSISWMTLRWQRNHFRIRSTICFRHLAVEQTAYTYNWNVAQENALDRRRCRLKRNDVHIPIPLNWRTTWIKKLWITYINLNGTIWFGYFFSLSFGRLLATAVVVCFFFSQPLFRFFFNNLQLRLWWC